MLPEIPMNLQHVFLYIAYDLEKQGFSVRDLAGATLFGVTKKYRPKDYQLIKEALNEFKKDPKAKFKLDNAIIAAYMNYYVDCKAHKIPDFLMSVFFFDFAFNALKHANIALQETVNYFYPNKLVVDGIVGPRTLNAVDYLLTQKDKNLIYWKFNNLRRLFYQNNKQKWFIKGWLIRVNKLEDFIFSNFIKKD